jgi:hypothetical protein
LQTFPFTVPSACGSIQLLIRGARPPSKHR